MKDLHTICTNPGTITDYATITVEPVIAGFGGAGMIMIIGLIIGTILITRKSKI